MSEITELRAEAKKRGINSFGMGAEALRTALNAGGGEETPARADRAESREQTGRRKRVPLGTPQQKLAYPQRPGYARRWFNDVGNRIHDAGQAGYEHVEKDEDGREVRVSTRVGTQEGGAPMIAYLMEIRQEFYDEDQATKQQAVDAIDDAILRRDQAPVDSAEPGKFYTPDEGVSIKVDT